MLRRVPFDDECPQQPPRKALLTIVRYKNAALERSTLSPNNKAMDRRKNSPDPSKLENVCKCVCVVTWVAPSDRDSSRSGFAVRRTRAMWARPVCAFPQRLNNPTGPSLSQAPAPPTSRPHADSPRKSSTARPRCRLSDGRRWVRTSALPSTGKVRGGAHAVPVNKSGFLGRFVGQMIPIY